MQFAEQSSEKKEEVLDFEHAFQPIYCLRTGNVRGLEALVRVKNGTPDTFFEHAKQTKTLYQVDSQSIRQALATWLSAGKVMKGELLFINVFPSSIVNSNFPTFINKIMQEFKLPHDRIVFELNETEKTFQTELTDLLKQRISFLKKEGFLIAIDDIGKGWSSLSTLIDIEPHFAKLDRYFSLNLSTSKKKQLMIQAIMKYCNENMIELVLEGLEKKVDLDMANSLDIPLAQGFLLGKPKVIEYETK
jgi:EAL domain-containing protein (putative c-di-GMP-specific phosphodiesterase class I)